jgi:3-oxoacyl-[acyl-carrier-protein] synthase II
MNRVAITGLGLIDTLGDNISDCFSEMKSNHYRDPLPYPEVFPDNEIKILDQIKVFPVYSKNYRLPKLESSLENSIGRSQKYILHAVESAIDDAGVDRSKKNVAVIVSNVTSGHDHYLDRFNRVVSGKRIKPTMIMQDGPDFAGSVIAGAYKFNGPTICPSSACITGIISLDYACRLVEEYDYVICGTGDCVLNPADLYNFLLLGALGEKSSPFDNQRNGFVPSEGAGCMILESEKSALDRNAKIYGFIEKTSLANDAYHLTSPDPDGTGAKNVMKSVTSEISKEDIAFCSAHATSTLVGDVIEYNAILDTLGKVPTMSFKSKIGHTMSSSSMIETIYTVLSLNQGLILPNFNLNACDFDNEKILVYREQKTNKKYVVKNSFAFGGKCASILISKE